MGWTEDRVAILTKMWTEGSSAAEIAKELGGVTRNAVIGKAHRLGLSGRASPIKKKKTTTTKAKSKKTTTKKKTTKKATTTKAKATKQDKKTLEDKKIKKEKKLNTKEKQRIIKKAIKEAAEEVANDSGDTGIGFMELSEKLCKWPIGDPQSADFYFCGKPSPQGIPYCQEHIEMAYQAPRKAGEKRKTAMKLVANIKDAGNEDGDIEVGDVDIEPAIDDVDDDDTVIATEISDNIKTK